MRTERMIVTFGIGAALLSTAAPVAGQRGGAADRAAVSRPWPPERLPDGQPDVQGTYGAVNGGSTSLTNPMSNNDDLERHRTGGKETHAPSRIIDPPDGQLPYQPWAAARQKQQEHDYDRPTKPEHIDPQHRCLISGVPRLYTIVPAFKIVQIPGSVVFIWDEYHAYRVIPLDGRPHVGPNVKLWMGDARGHWEGNTLVIDTTNVRGSRLTYIGDFYTDNAHIVERLTFVDANTLTYEATVDDPTVFTRRWTMRITHRRRPDEEMWETACYEGNKNPDRWLLKPETAQK
jgi:hypothetical protein